MHSSARCLPRSVIRRLRSYLVSGSLSLPLVLTLAACAEETPCPHEGPGQAAPSAGCFAVLNGELLLVRGLNGKISVPGGSSLPGDAAKCTAFRVTLVESVLRLDPGVALRVFATGFVLYRCTYGPSAGEIGPPPPLEILEVLYLSPERFDEYQWRFPEQKELLREMLRRSY